MCIKSFSCFKSLVYHQHVYKVVSLHSDASPIHFHTKPIKFKFSLLKKVVKTLNALIVISTFI